MIIFSASPGRSVYLDEGRRNLSKLQVNFQQHAQIPDPVEVSTHSSVQRPIVDHQDPPQRELPDRRPVRAASHRRFLTIATMMKNERRWLREWIEFNTMMGADHFILYDNGSEDLPLEILQPYIDKGLVTFIPWPPESIPPPPEFKTRLEEWQYTWFRDSLETCLEEHWPVHQHAPCQVAAFADAVKRSKDGVSRWLGIFDIDEYVFPLPSSQFRRVADLLRSRHEHDDHVRIYGASFGSGGHIHHAAMRKEGDPLQALMTESYIYRAPLDRSFYGLKYKLNRRRGRPSTIQLGRIIYSERTRTTWRHPIQRWRWLGIQIICRPRHVRP